MQHDVRATYIYHTHVTNVGFFGKFILTVKTMKSTSSHDELILFLHKKRKKWRLWVHSLF